jgi:hypothetical protein
MNEPQHETSGGVPVTDESVESLAAQAEEGYEVTQLYPRGQGGTAGRITWRHSHLSAYHGRVNGMYLFSVGPNVRAGSGYRLTTELPGITRPRHAALTTDHKTQEAAQRAAERLLVYWVKKLGASFPAEEENEA